MADREQRRGRDSPTPTDGRERRGLQSREKILQAVYELVREKQGPPTAEQVAERAQVGQRTVFRHFADMEALNADMRARVESEVAPLLLEEIAAAGDLEKRLQALVSKRSSVFEHLGPFRRAGRALPAQSDAGGAQLARVLRAEITRVFARELKGSQQSTVEAVDAMASFEVWERLRRDQHLGRERAKAVVVAALRTLLEKG